VTGILVPVAQISPAHTSDLLLKKSCHATTTPVYFRKGRRPRDQIELVCENNARAAMRKFDRISVDPGQMGGVPCVRHMRIPVATVLRLLTGGLSEAEIRSEYPDLQAEDIRECLRFAAASVMEGEIPLPSPATGREVR
jgi:uncharacterized protein (DUF433 family)